MVRICSSSKSDSEGRVAMLSAESQVDVILGQWKNNGFQDLLRSQPVGVCRSPREPKDTFTAPLQWQSRQKMKSAEVPLMVWSKGGLDCK